MTSGCLSRVALRARGTSSGGWGGPTADSHLMAPKWTPKHRSIAHVYWTLTFTAVMGGHNLADLGLLHLEHNVADVHTAMGSVHRRRQRHGLRVHRHGGWGARPRLVRGGGDGSPAGKYDGPTLL